MLISLQQVALALLFAVLMTLVSAGIRALRNLDLCRSLILGELSSHAWLPYIGFTALVQKYGAKTVRRALRDLHERRLVDARISHHSFPRLSEEEMKAERNSYSFVGTNAECFEFRRLPDRGKRRDKTGRGARPDS